MYADNQNIVWSECHFSFMSFLCDMAYQICQAEDHLETGHQNEFWYPLTGKSEDKEQNGGKKPSLPLQKAGHIPAEIK